MKKLSKLVSLMLSVVLCVGMAAPALAVEYDISLGDVTVTESGSWQKGHETYTESNMSTDKDITITQANNETATSNTITVGENVTDTTITLKDVNIDVSSGWPYKAALSITGEKSDVIVNLEGENILKSGWNHAGLELNEGASVTIQSPQSSDGDIPGSLTATGGRDAAGIGSGNYGTAGDITITNGAKVNAQGCTYSFVQAADIGSGDGGSAGSILITGGADVTVGGGAIGIGGNVDDITISGNATKVTAKGYSNFSADSGPGSIGIGGNTGSKITIEGATVAVATGSKEYYNVGIGSHVGSAGDIKISGGADVYAYGDRVGIGSNKGGTVGNITIEDSTITAKSFFAGIGIGSVGANPDIDKKSTAGDIIIKNSSVTATKGFASADIGSKYGSTVGKITIWGEKTKLDAGKIGAADSTSTADTVEVRNIDENGKLIYIHHPKDGDRAEFTVEPPLDGEKIIVNDDEGQTVRIPEESTVKRGKDTIPYPNGAIVDQDGNIISTDVKKNDNGTVTVTTTTEKPDGTTEKRAETTVYVPEDIKSTPESNTTLPKDSTITGKDDDDNKSVITYPNGAEIDKDGNVTGDGVVKTEKDDNVEVKGADLDYTVRPPESGEDKLEVKTDGSVDIPNGGVSDDGRNETTYPDGGRVNPDGTITGEGATVSKDKDTGDVTIKNSDGETITIDVPEEKKDEVKVDEQGTTTVPEGGKVTDKDGKEIDLPFGGEVDKEGNVTAYPDPNPPTNPPVTPPTADDPELDVPMGDGSGADAATIADQEVPLAGLMPVAQLLEALRQHEGIEDAELPEDFKWLNHEYAQAIYWGLQEELVSDTEEAPFDPDEVITVALLREVLINFVEFKGCDFVVTVEGEDDEIVFDLGERLTAFYAELEAYLKAQKTKAA